jgi:hypothetical protein
LRSKIEPAVNCGRKVCIAPAVNSLAPTAQKVNHLPMSAMRSAAPGARNASTATDAAGRTSIQRRMVARYMVELPKRAQRA